MGADDPADVITGGIENGVDMRRFCRTRVNNRYVLVPQQIGVGAWARHNTWIGRYDATLTIS